MMHKKCFILALLIFWIICGVVSAENVMFKSNNKSKDDKPLMLTGILAKPAGDGPFPAVVLLHGASGLQDGMPRSETWANRLVKWGYVTLQVDSFGPRGVTSVHENPGSYSSARVRDAYDAKSFLADLSFVDQNRIAVLGWSHGGWIVLKALRQPFLTLKKGETPFNAAVAFYPYCDRSLDQSFAPLLILIGEKDDYVSASSCSSLMPSMPTEHEVILKVYPGAYHDFDWEGKDEVFKGHRCYVPDSLTSGGLI